MVTYAFDRAQIPKGLSYPLKRSALDAALAAGSITALAAVYFWMRQRGDLVLRANYSGETHRDAAGAGQATVRVYAGPAPERHATEVALLQEGVPRLVAWLRAANVAGNVWRASDHHLTMRYDAGRLHVEESE